MKPFHFKQFTIQQRADVFKVGTDGLLLGAWADVSDARNLLDIGTGTGIVALMCGQKNQELDITAIDINPNAVDLANQNFQESPFTKNAKALNLSLETLLRENIKKWDNISCNPPYFVESTLSEKVHLQAARHRQAFDLNSLFQFASAHLSESGSLDIIYPFSGLEKEVLPCLKSAKLFLIRQTTVYSMEGKLPERVLLSFGKKDRLPVNDELIIQYEGRNNYTEAYKKLTCDFHTIF